MSSFYPKLITKEGGEANQFGYSTSKVVCVGRNYSEHAKELNNPIPKTPLLFIKSTNTLVDMDKAITLPIGLGECQHELEVAILIGENIGKNDKISDSAVVGVGLALDLTLRELQTKLKSKGHPWEVAKSFDGSCPVSSFNKVVNLQELSNIDFCMKKNQLIAQSGNTNDMIFDVKTLLEYIVGYFSLYPGDIVLTGTPKGVASLTSGDYLSLSLQNELLVDTKVN